MNKYYLRIILLFLCFLPLFSSSYINKELSIESISVKDDLSSNSIHKIAFDEKGFLWASSTKGFNKFNAHSTEKFYKSKDNFLTSNNIKNFIIDSNNKIWISGAPLVKYNPKSKIFSKIKDLGNKYINIIFESKNKTIWLIENGIALHQISSENKVVNSYYFQKNLGKELSIKSIAQDREGKLWLASNNGIIIFNIKEGKFYNFNMNKKLSSLNTKSFRHIMIDSNNIVWISSSSGLIQYDISKNKFKHFTYSSKNKSSLLSNDIWLTYEDSKKDIWIGTDKKGISKYIKDDNFLNYNTNTLPKATIMDIKEDKNGVLWLGINNYGIYSFKFNQKKFKYYKKEAGKNKLSFNNLLDLHEDKDKNIWLASDGGGLIKFSPDSKEFKALMHDENKNSISTNSIISISEVDDTLWLGTWQGGLNSYNLKTKKFSVYKTNKNSALLGNSIFYIYKDKKDNLWLSVWGKGLHKFDIKTKKFTNYTSTNEDAPFNIKDKNINFIFESSDKTMYLGGYNGLVSIKDNKVKTLIYSKDSSFRDFYIESENIIWFATNSGLLRFDVLNNNKKFYNKTNGLVSDYLISMEYYKDGVFILGSDKGLSKFNTRTLKAINYEKSDGLQGLKFNRFSHLKASDGSFYFGGINGLNVFKNLEELDKKNHYNIELINLYILQKKEKVNAKGILKKDISYLNEITIPYDKRDISFEFSILSFSDIKKHKYRYTLEGYDKSWKEESFGNRFIRYTNLSPGKYILKVRGSVDGRNWNSPTKYLNVLILKPWWLKTNFIFLSLVICLYMLFLYIRYKRNLIIKNEQRLEKEVLLKSNDLQKALIEINDAKISLEYRVEERTEELENEIKQKEKVEKELLFFATHDQLTGCTNRYWFNERVSVLLKKVKNEKNYNFAFVYINGNKFKAVNKRYGHNIGDKLLKLFVKRLQTILCKNISLSRKSGDEFVLLIENKTQKEVEILLNNIIELVDTVFVIDNIKVFYHVSMGVVLETKDYKSVDLLRYDADISMNYAKKELKKQSTYQLFDLKMRELILEELELLIDLKKALKNDDFYMVYQPIVNAKSLELHGFEALIRWDYKKRFVGPDVFIPMAEKHGLINDLGLWIINTVIKQFHFWLQEYKGKDFKMAINLSANQLAQVSLLDEINKVLNKYEIEPSMVKFEITETALMDDFKESNKVLEEMSKVGLELALDDFGTGYSSLSYLHTFPINYLKIDKSFINYIELDSQALEITKAVISLAKTLGIKLIAEGVENELQLKLLQELDCEYIQGYHIEKPLKSVDIENKWLLK